VLVWALVGTLLLFVPFAGLLVFPLFVLWSLAVPLFVDNQHIPLKVRLAYRLSSRFVWRKLCLVLGTLLFMVLINFLGMLFFVVPVLFTLAYSAVLYVYLYQALVGVNGVAVLIPQQLPQPVQPAVVALAVAAPAAPAPMHAVAAAPVAYV